MDDGNTFSDLKIEELRSLLETHKGNITKTQKRIIGNILKGKTVSDRELEMIEGLISKICTKDREKRAIDATVYQTGKKKGEDKKSGASREFSINRNIRRKKIYELILRGWSYRQIQLELGVSPNTISNDLQFYRDQAEKDFDDRKHKSSVERILREFEMIKQKSLNLAEDFTDSASKSRMFQRATEVLKNETRILMEVGTIRTVPQRQEITGGDGGPIETTSPYHDKLLEMMANNGVQFQDD